MRGWKVAFLAGLGYAGMPAEDVIASLKRLGYEGIEWTTSHFDVDRPLAELRGLVAKTRDAGLDVSRIMAHEDLSASTTTRDAPASTAPFGPSTRRASATWRPSAR